MNREDAESLVRDCEGDWYREWRMFEDIACHSRWTQNELEADWQRMKREWAVEKLMGGKDGKD